MGESLSTWTPSCNGSVRVELSGQRTTSDSGALLLREALDSSGVIEALGDNLVDRLRWQVSHDLDRIALPIDRHQPTERCGLVLVEEADPLGDQHIARRQLQQLRTCQNGRARFRTAVHLDVSLRR